MPTEVTPWLGAPLPAFHSHTLLGSTVERFASTRLQTAEAAEAAHRASGAGVEATTPAAEGTTTTTTTKLLGTRRAARCTTTTATDAATPRSSLDTPVPLRVITPKPSHPTAMPSNMPTADRLAGYAPPAYGYQGGGSQQQQSPGYPQQQPPPPHQGGRGY